MLQSTDAQRLALSDGLDAGVPPTAHPVDALDQLRQGEDTGGLQVAGQCRIQPVIKTGEESREEAKATVDAEGVSGATFALTFLWWIVMVVHPAKDPETRRSLRALPRQEVDPRFRGFVTKPEKAEKV